MRHSKFLLILLFSHLAFADGSTDLISEATVQTPQQRTSTYLGMGAAMWFAPEQIIGVNKRHTQYFEQQLPMVLASYEFAPTHWGFTLQGAYGYRESSAPERTAALHVLTTRALVNYRPVRDSSLEPIIQAGPAGWLLAQQGADQDTTSLWRWSYILGAGLDMNLKKILGLNEKWRISLVYNRVFSEQDEQGVNLNADWLQLTGVLEL